MAEDTAAATPATDESDVRRKALMRLGIAGVVTVSALAALWWLDRSGGPEPKTEPPARPAPIVTAPAPVMAPPVEPESNEPGPEAELPAGEEPVEPAPPPPPPPVAPDASRRAPSPAARMESSAAPARPPQAAPAPVAPRPLTPPSAPTPPLPSPAGAASGRPPAPAAPAPVTDRGYVVQLGVFSNPANAQELVQRLRGLGVEAQTETRVQVGPFLNRAEAERVQAELRRMGIQGMILKTAVEPMSYMERIERQWLIAFSRLARRVSAGRRGNARLLGVLCELRVYVVRNLG